MQHDVRLKAAVRAIFDACHLSDYGPPMAFEEAARCGTIHYREAAEVARSARLLLGETLTQLKLL